MKKILLAGAGLLAMSVYGAQAAEPLKLSIGGTAVQWFTYSTNKQSSALAGLGGNVNGATTKAGKFDEQGWTLIQFKGETRLDNGLTVGVDVDYHASQGKDTFTYFGGANGQATERAYAYVSSAYGKIIAGETNNGISLIHVSAPDVSGIGGQDGWWMDFVEYPVLFSDSRNRTHYADDYMADKIIYMTPTFYGFQGVASYTPDSTPGNTGNLNVPTSNRDLYTVGLAYTGTVGPVGVKADFGFAQGLQANSTFPLNNVYSNNTVIATNQVGVRAYEGGLQAAYGPFTLGGSAIHREVVDSNNTAIGLQNRILAGEGDSFDVGVSYVAAPFGVSFTYFRGASANYATGTPLGAAAIGQAAPTGTSLKDDVDTVYTLGGSYILGPGITWQNALLYVDYSSASKSPLNTNSGWMGVTALSINF